MSKVSVIIPSYKETYLQKTVSDLLSKGGNIEVIVVLDGYIPVGPITGDKRLIVLSKDKHEGLRSAVNDGVAIAKGKYIMKYDAHCIISPDFDTILQADIEDNWIVTPNRCYLDPAKWLPEGEIIDCERFIYPFIMPRKRIGLYTPPWPERGNKRKKYKIDEELAYLGCCYFMTKEHFTKRLGGLQNIGYGTFMCDHLEMSLKTQLGFWEGKLMRNKNVLQAHLKKAAKYKPLYYITVPERVIGNRFTFNYWWNNQWEKRAHDFEWLIDKFLPIPEWPANWTDYKNIFIGDLPID